MNDYSDTSFLCGIYRKQDNTPEALAYRNGMTDPIRVSTLLEFEFRQAIRLQVWLHSQDKKKGYTQTEADQMLADWESDLAVGHVEIIATDADAVLRMAENLSKTHTALTGNRTLDILHIATAKHLSAKHFLSFDARQKKLAKAVGLKTPL
jgi:predicted nucleic acid-binding protein